jgi:ketosteroid isomerase-like protein
MSQENVERFHRIWAEWDARRELSADFLAADAAWVNPSDAVERGVKLGIEGFNEAIRRVFDAWEEVRFEIDRVIDHGDDVVALGHLRNRGRTAGIELASPHGQLWTFRDGKVTSMRWFNSHSEALDAAGL